MKLKSFSGNNLF